MNIKEAIKCFLEENGYDGLYNSAGECACRTDDLFPCAPENCPTDCQLGILGPGRDGFDWVIGPREIPPRSQEKHKKKDIMDLENDDYIASMKSFRKSLEGEEYLVRFDKKDYDKEVSDDNENHDQ